MFRPIIHRSMIAAMWLVAGLYAWEPTTVPLAVPTARPVPPLTVQPQDATGTRFDVRVGERHLGHGTLRLVAVQLNSTWRPPGTSDRLAHNDILDKKLQQRPVHRGDQLGSFHTDHDAARGPTRTICQRAMGGRGFLGQWRVVGVKNRTGVHAPCDGFDGHPVDAPEMIRRTSRYPGLRASGSQGCSPSFC